MILKIFSPRFFFSLFISLFLLDIGVVSSASSDLEKRIDDLERQIINLRLNEEGSRPLDISGHFTNVFHQYSFERDVPTLQSENAGFFATSFYLNFDKTNHQKAKFYSSFASDYLWNNNFFSGDFVRQERATRFSDYLTILKKAYIDYFVFDSKLALSIGRLPTQKGPPFNYANNQSRQGTYPGLIYSVPLDGIALTANIGKMILSDQRMIFRLIYTPFYDKDFEFRPTLIGRKQDTIKLKRGGGEAMVANFEISDETWMGDYNIILMAFHSDIARPGALENQRGVLQGELDKTSPGTSDANIYDVSTDGESLVVMQSAIFYFEINDLFNSKLDIYASFKKSITKSRDNYEALVVEDNMGGALGTVGTVHQLPGLHYNDSSRGESYFVGSRYHFTDKFNLGLEYIRQTWGSTPTVYNAENFLRFYSVIGYGYHFYINWKLEKNLNLTWGYNYLNAEVETDYSAFYLAETGYKLHDTYLSLRYNF